MKRNITTRLWSTVSLIGLIYTGVLAQQNQSITNLDPNQAAFNDSRDALNLTGMRIKPNAVSALDDNLLLYPNWSVGMVNFQNGKQVRQVELKFNLFTNELYFKNNNKANLFADPVKAFFMTDTSNGLSATASFSNGYPSFENKTGNTFYLVLESGPIVHLLKYISKKKREVYQYGSAAKTEYEIKEDLLVYDVKNNILVEIKNNLSSLIKALPAYSTMLQDAAKNKKPKRLSDQDILAMLEQLNSKTAN